MSVTESKGFSSAWDEKAEWSKLSTLAKKDDNTWFKYQRLLLEKVLEKTDEEKKETGEIADVSEIDRKRQLEEWIRDIKDIPSSNYPELIKQFLDDSYRYGPLQPLWEMQGITDIQVFVPRRNTDEQIISYMQSGKRKIFKDQKFKSYEHVRDWVNTQLTKIGLRYDPAKVELNGMLPGGERIHIVSGPVAYSKYKPGDKTKPYHFVNCIIVTIRLFNKSFTLEQLTTDSMPQHKLPFKLKEKKKIDELYERKPVYSAKIGGIACKATMDFFRIAGQLKKSKIYSGSTGSGKTTVLNADTVNINENEQLLFIEEAPEVQPQIEGHVIRLYERPGVYSPEDAVRSSLRMFPSRIYISEIRDGIGYLFMRVIMSGHDGSASTIHASSCHAALDQLIQLASSHKDAPSRDIIERIFKERLGYIVHLNAADQGKTMKECCEIDESGELHCVSRLVEGYDEANRKQSYYEFIGPTERFVEEMIANGIDIPASWNWKKIS